LIGSNRAYHTELKSASISALKTICSSILSYHVTWCTKLQLHLTILQQRSVNQDRPLNIWSSQPQLKDQLIVISGLQPSGAPVYHANVRTLAYLRDSLSPPTGVSLSLIRSPTSGHLKTLAHHRKVTRLLSSKTQAVFIIFTAEYGRKKVVTSSATRSFKPSILSPQPSTTIEITFIKILFNRSTIIYPCWPEITPKNYTPPTVVARELHTTQGYFHNFLRSSRVFQFFSYIVALR